MSMPRVYKLQWNKVLSGALFVLFVGITSIFLIGITLILLIGVTSIFLTGITRILEKVLWLLLFVDRKEKLS